MRPKLTTQVSELLAQEFSQRTVADILERLRRHDVPCGPILSAEEVLVDPQVVHNGTIVQWQHELAGTVQQPVPAARFEKTPAAVAESGSLKGADNDAILGELGRSAEQIAALRDAGTII